MYKLARLVLTDDASPSAVIIGRADDPNANVELRIPKNYTLEAQTRIEVINGTAVNYGDLEINAAAATLELPSVLTDAGYVLIDGLAHSARSANVFDNIHKILCDDIIGNSINVYDLIDKKPSVNDFVFGERYSRNADRLKGLTEYLGVGPITHVSKFEGDRQTPDSHAIAYLSALHDSHIADSDCAQVNNIRDSLFERNTVIRGDDIQTVSDSEIFYVSTGYRDGYLVSGYNLKKIARQKPTKLTEVTRMINHALIKFDEVKFAVEPIRCYATAVRFSEDVSDSGRVMVTASASSMTASRTLAGEVVIGTSVAKMTESYVFVEDLNLLAIANIDTARGISLDPPHFKFPHSDVDIDEVGPYSQEILAKSKYGFAYADNTVEFNAIRRPILSRTYSGSIPFSGNVVSDVRTLLYGMDRPMWQGIPFAFENMLNDGHIVLARTIPGRSAYQDRVITEFNPDDIYIGPQLPTLPAKARVYDYTGELSLLRKDGKSFIKSAVSSRFMWYHTAQSIGTTTPQLAQNQYYIVELAGPFDVGLSYANGEDKEPTEAVNPVYLTKSWASVNLVCSLLDRSIFRGVIDIELDDVIGFDTPAPGGPGPSTPNPSEPTSPQPEGVPPVSPQRAIFRVDVAYQMFAEKERFDLVEKLMNGGFDDHDFIELTHDDRFVRINPRKWQAVRKFVQLSGLVTGGLLLIGLMIKREDGREEEDE